MLEINKKAPEFSLSDQNGNMHTLEQYSGDWLLLYFYPKDDTPGCTQEACTIRDVWSAFKEANLKVLGVSADSVKKHKKFEEKHSLPFTLLSDESKGMLDSYEALVEKSMFGKKYMRIARISYLIDPQGIIKKVYPKVKPSEHAEEVLADFRNLSNK